MARGNKNGDFFFFSARAREMKKEKKKENLDYVRYIFIPTGDQFQRCQPAMPCWQDYHNSIFVTLEGGDVSQVGISRNIPGL